jgi:glycerate kinase
MKFVLAPDSFKESMSAHDACVAMEKGIREVFPTAECVKIPMADGGEGTVEALVTHTGGRILETEVIGPMGQKVIAKYGISGDGHTAIMEMASASGIQLVAKEDRNPLHTTSYGTGQLLQHALNHQVKTIVIGIGGSVTNDGGAGMMQALGVSLLDRDGMEISFGGVNLKKLHSIDCSKMDPRLRHVHIQVACDVTNPLLGPNGASYTFGPQKGATPEMVEQLEESLTHFAKVVELQLGINIGDIPGGGAAGGLGAGLIAFLNAELKKGVELVVEQTGLEQQIIGADYVFTGEGSIDGQTLFGKTPYGVASIAKKHQVPVIAFSGKVGADVDSLYDSGFTAIIGILREITSLDIALSKGSDNLAFSVTNVCRLIQQARSISK